MVSFSFEGLLSHGDGWRGLGDGLQENSAPANGVLLLAEECGQVELCLDISFIQMDDMQVKRFSNNLN